MQLISGAVGGNNAGAVLKNLSLSTVHNSVVGILGGGIGGQLLGMLGMDRGAARWTRPVIIGSIAGGGVGGGVLLAIVGAIKKAMGK